MQGRRNSSDSKKLIKIKMSPDIKGLALVFSVHFVVMAVDAGKEEFKGPNVAWKIRICFYLHRKFGNPSEDVLPKTHPKPFCDKGMTFPLSSVGDFTYMFWVRRVTFMPCWFCRMFATLRLNNFEISWLDLGPSSEFQLFDQSLSDLNSVSVVTWASLCFLSAETQPTVDFFL